MPRPRQERAELTRQAILDGAARAFDRDGFIGTSLSSVAANAGVTKGALYFHFASKEELAHALMVEQFKIAAGVDALPDPGLQTAIDLTHQMAHALRTNLRVRAGIRLILEFGSFTDPDPTPYDTWILTCRNCLAPAQAHGDLHPHLDVDALATHLVGSFTGIQITSHVRTGRADLHTRLTDHWTLLLPAITPPERLPGLNPAGSARCRADLGLPARLPAA
ncbi:ScbR family autoregulator-binding transcription factor (plasmid) [Streptomyces sp. BI20]|uniref:ScbR family autoregulator-binding transcription factor n=1 Tax=Streptomyces sp. BI20 TaxID=3403460 RepID=UPI003C730BCB